MHRPVLGPACLVPPHQPSFRSAGRSVLVVGFVSLVLLVSGCSDEEPAEEQQAEEAPAGEESVGEQGGSGEAVVVEGFAVPDKVPLKSPPLGTALDDLVSAFEAGDISEEEAAASAPVSRGRSVAVTVHLSGNVDGMVTLLADNKVSPRHVGSDFVEAFVPVRLLREVSDTAGVLFVEPIVPPEPPQATVQSVLGEGPGVHGSEAWNDAGFTGAGVKVGVIDAGFEGFAELMGTELPATVQAKCYSFETDAYGGFELCTSAGGDHGTVVAESIIDIAPDAELYIGTPATKGDLLDITEWMITEGVSVINMSLGFVFDGPGDGTSPSELSPLKAVDYAVDGTVPKAEGPPVVGTPVVWVNAAGNNARGAWFGVPTDVDGDKTLEFDGREQLALNGGTWVQLRWDGAWYGETLDLDLYLYDENGEVLKRSLNPQLGGGGHRPYEWFGVPGNGQALLQVATRDEDGRLPAWIQMMAWSGSIEGANAQASMNTPAESLNSGMLTVGAAHWQTPDIIESYSSRGPTPSGATKPDIVGAACGSTATSEVVCGTSQASPHIAGLAALVRQRFPDFSPQQVVAYLKDNADRSDNPDNTWGHGLAALPQDIDPDRAALEALYNATGGDNWTDNTNWLTDQPLNQWHGVTTNPDGRVTSLDLYNNKLTGRTPPQIGNLTNLEALLLGGNQFTGEIPPEIGDLTNLAYLDFHHNQLSRRIPPEIGNLTNLRTLLLGGNQLTGEIPPQLGNLTNLQQLWLYSNQFTGEIPPEIGNLTNLVELTLYDNQLTGEIPPEIGNLTNLQLLGLGGSQLTGEIPPEIGNLTNLQLLGLGGSQLTGEIPAELGRLANLQRLWLYHNPGLSGPLPVSLTGLGALDHLAMDGTQLCVPSDEAFQRWLLGVEVVEIDDGAPGCEPTELDRAALEALYRATDGDNWTDNTNWLTGEPLDQWHGVTTGGQGRVTGLSLSENRLSGRVPPWLGGLTSLESLSLDNNQLSGAVPTELDSFTSLESLDLSDNSSLSGPLPGSFTGLEALEALQLDGTELCAPDDAAFQAWLQSVETKAGVTDCVPEQSPDRAALEALYRATNGPEWTNNTNWLSDQPINRWHGVTTGAGGRMTHLHLAENRLNGTLPPELGSLTDLTELDLGNNQLSGAIPAQVGRLTSLETLVLADNELSGSIPAQLGDLTNLGVLLLAGNRLSGPIPAQLGRLTSLETLVLADNQLSGAIPARLGSLSNLRGLLLGGNPDLSGPLPNSFTGLETLEDLWLDGTQLCAPTDAAFQAWLRGVDGKAGVTDCTPEQSPDRAALEALYRATNGPNWTNSTNWLTDEPINQWHGVTTNTNGRVTRLELSNNQLDGQIPAALGNLTNLQQLRLGANRLSGAIPAALGSLTNLESLWLGANQLSGTVPAQLGDLASLASLEFSDNSRLSGPLPGSFSGLDELEALRLDGTGLCAPDDAAFQRWLRSVETTSGVTGCAPAQSPDRAALEALYRATNGPDWTNKTNWLTDQPISQWRGVTTDAEGRVTRLDGRLFGGNQLRGRIPAELGSLAKLQALWLGGNELSGSIPSELGNLTNLRALALHGNAGLSGPLPGSFTGLEALESLRLDGTGLCAPEDATFQAWLRGVETTTGLTDCATTRSPDRAALEALYRATDGPNWTNNTNWLTDQPLNQWHGVTTNTNERVTRLQLVDNQLSGAIPAALGSLTNLTELDLGHNQLSGAIPAQVGSLTNLETLVLADNELSGAIPAQLGGLTDLEVLLLGGNRLSGSIPGALGSLAELESLWLDDNRLSGAVPAALGGLSNLRGLLLHGNSGLSGALPGSFTGLETLEDLWLEGTRLCAPTDVAFQRWLRGVEGTSGVTNCASAQSPDRAALEALYRATNGPGWANNTNWLTDQPLSQWHGVTTNADRRVTRLELSNNQLSGAVPAQLGDLTNLQELQLSSNQLSGAIPAQLGRLTNLQKLKLGSNQLSGAIPAQLGRLTNLQNLNARGNQLSGTIPAQLGNLSDLRELLLDGNRLSGAIPAALGSLTDLEALWLNDNRLSGAIPAALGNLSDLRTLLLSGNSGLSGPLPGSFTRLSVLERLSLRGTQLCAPTDAAFQAWLRHVERRLGVTDCAPAQSPDRVALVALYRATDGPNWFDDTNWLTDEPLSQWHGVTTNTSGRVIRLSFGTSNNLSGSIPAALGNLTNLTHLDLSWNEGLSGSLPGSLTGLEALESLQLGGTNLCAPTDAAFQAWLRGVLTREVTDCAPPQSPDRAALVVLYNATDGPNWTNNYNWLTDQPISQWSGVTTNTNGRVTGLWISYNQLSGSIPAELGNLTNLTNLQLHGNQLSGSIPAALGNLTNLTTLGLHINELSGSIPAELGDLTNLEELALGKNQLSGSIPAELGNLTNLTNLQLHGNQLSGSIPAALGNLTNLIALGLQGNQLSGSIPAALGNLTNLGTLQLSDNRLSGSIPAELGNLTNLTTLWLRINELSGSIPAELGDLTNLRQLFLSGNQLSGCIPRAVWDLTNVMYAGHDLGELGLETCS